MIFLKEIKIFKMEKYMKKLLNKIVKIFSGIGLALFALGNKVMALDITTDLLYGPPNPDLYGVVKPEKTSFWEKILPIIKIVFIPLILIIGLIIYWRKSKSDKGTKILLIICIVIFVLIIYGAFYFFDAIKN